ncbi:hypothetical protein AGABI1DRAFT_109917 [Agaricus bisporus var. burnettii JB137-S8]|uniref:Uncharacterized protein n=1 Tax=Agaricus bisporus var. burnettii (strain JB137-S8 / ATCC MYA-4627 / FGSC 10392) TaxID=597362 RepID=K5WV40_AGABU|nr:uncharacterized protein AGABI1DRAFT_109917 [Agaricus bisporus var. burnettii JB137-S8]EKM74628.1 hypothetical protein AGABI1DRAFT_109917 [Agaricus bisporus var. burnettii JB137-S8]
MATESAPSLVEWNSLSEDGQIKQQEEITKYLKEPDTLDKFKQDCRDVGRTAVAIDDGLRFVQRGFFRLAEKYGKDFPLVGEVYVTKWNGFMAVSNSTLNYCPGISLVHISAGKETQGSSGLQGTLRRRLPLHYGENLDLIADIKSTEDLKDAQAELKQYVQKHPIHIATKVADGFKDLANDIHDFSKDFTHYLEETKQNLTEDAEQFKSDINKLQTEINELNVKIHWATVALSVTMCMFLFAAAPAGFLAKYTIERNGAAFMESPLAKWDQLKKAQTNLTQTISKQKALAALEVDFEKLKPNIEDICQKLSIFAGIWAFATEQSTEINIALEAGTEVIASKKFKIKLALLVAQIKPLREGMREYATQIR